MVLLLTPRDGMSVLGSSTQTTWTLQALVTGSLYPSICYTELSTIYDLDK